VRAGARTSRLRLLLAVVLVLLGTSTAIAPAPGEPGAGATLSSASPVHQELHDWLRLSGVARHAVSTPDGWWAVHTRAVDTHPPLVVSSLGAASRADAVTTTPTSQSSRAPPVSH